MKKSNAIFGVSTNEVVEQIKKDSSTVSTTGTKDESQKKVNKQLIKTRKIIGHNTKNK